MAVCLGLARHRNGAHGVLLCRRSIGERVFFDDGTLSAQAPESASGQDVYTVEDFTLDLQGRCWPARRRTLALIARRSTAGP